jgi:hypothetical protein
VRGGCGGGAERGGTENFSYVASMSEYLCKFAAENVDRFVMIATTRKNAKTLFSKQSASNLFTVKTKN